MKKLMLLPLALIGLSGCVAYSDPYGYGYNQPAASVYVQPGYIYGAPPVYRHGGPGFRGDRRDNDRDGVPDRFDRDRDGDGVPNRNDRRPGNPRQY
jgi:hypothetical protein